MIGDKSAYDLGFEAHQTGKANTGNPYAYDSECWEQWIEGWNEAAIDGARKLAATS